MITRARLRIRDQWSRATGATAVEYALMAGLIALAIVLAVTALGTTLVGIFQDAADGFP
ncbi:Flp family type IVb pilin [Janibacter sp. G56]|uniref:Flp family type IVb pilin n=1 Tax=Janibacter sp. G56 TaxID=3418717 RepID=UPI003D016A00